MSRLTENQEFADVYEGLARAYREDAAAEAPLTAADVKEVLAWMKTKMPGAPAQGPTHNTACEGWREHYATLGGDPRLGQMRAVDDVDLAPLPVLNEAPGVLPALTHNYSPPRGVVPALALGGQVPDALPVPQHSYSDAERALFGRR